MDYLINLIKNMVYASYEPGGFAVNIERINYDLIKGQVSKDDFPSFIHEWCHYFQEITTISAQNGFYLWMRDLVYLTKITCSTSGAQIEIPMRPHDYGGYLNKYQRLYRKYCENIKEENIENPIITAPYKIEAEETDEFTEDSRVYARCLCYVNNKQFVLSLVALQEINAYYAQKVAEELLPDVDSNIKGDDMDTYPYHFGDLLFDEYRIISDVRMKFCITYMCLDTLQPPVLFLKTLEKLQGQSLLFSNCDDVNKAVATIKELTPLYAHSNEEAYTEIFKDYEQWLDDGHECLKTALKWYVEKIKRAVTTNKAGEQMLPFMVCESLQSLEFVVNRYPVPLFKIDGLVTPDASADERESLSAMTFWMLKKVCALLTCQTVEDINKYAECPFYKYCQYKKDVGKEYECKTSYWSILQGETKARCPFGIALHTMGLWQNELVVTVC